MSSDRVRPQVNSFGHVGFVIGGIALAAGSFFLGRSTRPKRMLERRLNERPLKMKDLDFKPLYRLARLLLIARLVD